MKARVRYRNLLMVLAGILGLLLKRWFARYLGDLAISCAGNLCASFAVYFIISLAPIPRRTRVMTAALALLVVEGFELADGFGIMTNVYDPIDFAANAIGIGLATCVDVGSSHLLPVKGGSA